jgi:propionyl-CoA synthetase
VLYTSGTTGNPKGVVRDNAGHMVALKNSMEMVYGLKPGEVFWAARYIPSLSFSARLSWSMASPSSSSMLSDIGWVVGHSYIAYGPLLEGATTVLYEGKPVGTPDVRTHLYDASRNHIQGSAS